jgi:hypothetical protein
MGKKPDTSLLDNPAQPAGNIDIFANPAAEARRKKAELEKLTAFDPAEFAEPEQPEAAGQTLTAADTGGDYVALEEARKNRDALVRRNREWEKQTQENPEANTAEIAEEYELEPEEFGKFASEMESQELGAWKRREDVKTAIRKVWNVDSSTLSRMENRGLDHSSLSGSDNLKGNLSDDQIYEYLGSDEQEWAQNAWEMLREDTPPKPGRHDKEWLRKHADYFTRLQNTQIPQEVFAEPEDGMPFSRRSLTRQMDKYFRLRSQQNAANIWTLLDSWL